MSSDSEWVRGASELLAVFFFYQHDGYIYVSIDENSLYFMFMICKLLKYRLYFNKKILGEKRNMGSGTRLDINPGSTSF